MFFFSKCELEKLSRDNREKLVEALEGHQEKWFLDRDTYQYLLVNVLKTIPVADKPHFYGYFYKRPELVEAYYKAMAPNQRTKFMAAMVELWQYKYASSPEALSDPNFQYALSKSIFGNANNSISFEKGRILLLPNDASFAVHPFEPVGIAFDRTSGSYAVVPALVGYHMSRDGKLEDLKSALGLTADLALLTVGAGEIALALRGVGTARKVGLASQQFLKASLRLGLGTTDIITSISSTYCNLLPQSGGEFCKSFKQYEVYLGLGLLTATTADLLYTNLNKSYTQEVRDALSKNPKHLEFVERELGVTLKNTEIQSLVPKLKGAYKTIYDDLLSAGLKAEDKANSILFKNYKNETVAILYENKFTPVKWSWSIKAKTGIITNTSEGYIIIKDGNEVTFDLGFKEGRKLETKEVNDYLVNGQGKDKDGQPYWTGTQVDELLLGKKGEIIYFVENYNNAVPNPGQYGSKDPITTIKELREKLAVKEAWKTTASEPTLRVYRVKHELKARSGTIGRQSDTGIELPGGGHQYEIIDYLGKNWENYLEVVGSRAGTKLK